MKNRQKYSIKKIKGDASFRDFYRKRINKFTSIIVRAHKEKEKNLLIYDAINKILNKNKVFAPKLYIEKYTKNFIEIEDFGNNSIYKILKKDKKKRFIYFKNAIKLLNQLQIIKNRKIKCFKRNIYIIPKYEKEILCFFKKTMRDF